MLVTIYLSLEIRVPKISSTSKEAPKETGERRTLRRPITAPKSDSYTKSKKVDGL